MTTNDTLICGCQIQIDRSGQGHSWRNIDASDIPADIREELEGEIVDGPASGEMVGSNGLHYRWCDTDPVLEALDQLESAGYDVTLNGCPASADSWDFAAKAVEAGELPRLPDSIDHDAPFVHCHFRNWCDKLA